MKREDYLPKEPSQEHFFICEKAVAWLGAVADGNGLRADQVRLARHDTGVYQLPGFIQVKLKPVVKEGEQRGQVPQGDVVGSKQEVYQRIEGLAADFIKAPDIQLEIQKILEPMIGHGWAMPHKSIPLSGTKKTLSHIDKCLKCAGLAQVDCPSCQTRGFVACTGCYGQGTISCQTCMGSGHGQDGPCSRCQGRGQIGCTACGGQRNVVCRECNQSGHIGCTECNMSGYWTHIYSVYFSGELEFVFDRQHVSPEMQEVVDKLGVQMLAVEKHAEVFKTPAEPHPKEILIPLIAFFPVGKAVFSIEGREMPAVVAGLNGRIVEMESFLDTSIKPGIVALSKITKGPLATGALLTTATKYKILRFVLSGLVQDTKKHVYQGLVKDYPVILSDKYARATIKYAEAALLTLSRTPRHIGLATGCLASGLLSTGYFLTGLRKTAAALGPAATAQPLLIADVLVWVLGYLMAFFAVRLFAASALKKIIPDTAASKSKGLPPAGNHGLAALGITFVIWIALAFLTPEKPDWVLQILTKIQ